MMNSISGNNGGHQKGSLKCKYGEIRPAPSICAYASCAATTHFAIVPPPHRALLHPAGVRLAAAASLCLLCTPSRLNEPSVNFWASRSEGSEPSRPQLSATGCFSAGFLLLLPYWTLISVTKATDIQVRGRLARLEL